MRYECGFTAAAVRHWVQTGSRLINHIRGDIDSSHESKSFFLYIVFFFFLSIQNASVTHPPCPSRLVPEWSEPIHISAITMKKILQESNIFASLKVKEAGIFFYLD